MFDFSKYVQKSYMVGKGLSKAIKRWNTIKYHIYDRDFIWKTSP